MHQILDAKITTIERIAKNICKMRLYAPLAAENAAAGKFINIYPQGKDILLPRPISISEIHADGLTLVFGIAGKGTQEFAAMQAGETLRISTPLGNGFDIQHMELYGERRSCGSIVLLGGGIGTPPLVELTKALRSRGHRNIVAVIGFKEEAFLFDELKSHGADVFVALETEGQNVLDRLTQAGLDADYAFACGPLPMLKALAAHFQKENVPLQVSMEERMGCGYGACVGCVCRTHAGQKRVCCDGPVFLADEVKWNE